MGKRTVKNKLITGANFRDFDWNKAKMFYHIVKCGSFGKAARLAETDQPTLSRQVQMLEKQVGCPLLIRKSGVGVTLTRKGEELLEMVAPFFLQAKGFCGNNYVEVAGEKKRKVRIVTTNAIASYVINDPIVAYSKDNPHIIFEIIGEDHDIDVILNDADIAIRPYDPEFTSVYQEPLFTLERKLFASDEYLNKYGEPQTVDDLKNHRLIVTASIPQDYPFVDIHWILKLGVQEGEKREAVFLSNSLECMVNAAKEGLGIIGSYEKMSLIKKSNLNNILPHIKEKGITPHFIFPSYLKEDEDIIKIKKYLKEVLN
jgi:DNA-binding transcriptional LysR family regulator